MVFSISVINFDIGKCITLKDEFNNVCNDVKISKLFEISKKNTKKNE